MSLIEEKINKNIIRRNNQTLQNNSQSFNYKIESLPTISFQKIPKIKKVNNPNNLKTIKSQTIKKAVKKILLSPISNLNNSDDEQINTNKTDYITKIIIENPPSVKNINFILENYLSKNKCESKYKSFYNNNTMMFMFEEEKIALDFMHLLFEEKQVNPQYRYTTININLSEKKNKLKLPEIKNKNRIASEVLKRLFYGVGYEKKEKPVKKNFGNFKFAIQSPFYYVNSKRDKKSMSELNSKEKNFFNKKLKGNFGDSKNGYFGIDEKVMKYNKNSRINLLNTSFKPSIKIIVREEDKSKWMSPLDFKMY